MDSNYNNFSASYIIKSNKLEKKNSEFMKSLCLYLTLLDRVFYETKNKNLKLLSAQSVINIFTIS